MRRRADHMRDLRAGGDHLPAGDRLGVRAVLHPTETPLHRHVAGARLGHPAVRRLLQLLPEHRETRPGFDTHTTVCRARSQRFRINKTD